MQENQVKPGAPVSNDLFGSRYKYTITMSIESIKT